MNPDLAAKLESLWAKPKPPAPTQAESEAKEIDALAAVLGAVGKMFDRLPIGTVLYADGRVEFPKGYEHGTK